MTRLIFHINYCYIQVLKLHKAFANGSSAHIKLSKSQPSKMVHLGGFLGRLLESLLKTGLPLMKSVLIPLGLELTAAAVAADAAIQKKIFGSGTTLIISNKEMDDIMKKLNLLKNPIY